MPEPEKDREARISQIVANAPNQRSRYKTFFMSGDVETKRRRALLTSTTYRFGMDSEGRIYIPRWLEVHHIEEGAIILGPVQRGRDYPKNPPKTKQLHQLYLDYIPAGIDVALRRTITIRDKYRLEKPQPEKLLEDNKEARQMIKGLELVAQLRQQTMNLSEITEEDLLEYAEKIDAYLTECGLNNPRLADKKRIREMLLKGFKDKTGKVNPLAIFTRTFSVEVNLRKRLENAFPNILTKYSNDAEMLRFERDKTRWVLSQSLEELKRIAENPQYQEISLVSQRLLSQVRVRPYLLGAYVAVYQLGTHFLPEGTSMRKIQERKRAQGLLSVRDLLMEGDFVGARAKLEFITKFLQKILDLHADYRTVKASEERRKRLEQTIY